MAKVLSVCIVTASALRFSFGVRARTEINIRYVKGMHMLKVISNEGFKE